MLNQLEKDRLVELEQAFALFNQTSDQLTQAYESLQNQVLHLQQQLAQSDSEKQRVADRLERLLTLLPAGVIVLSVDDEIMEMNPSAESILGIDAYGRNWDEVVRNVFLSTNDAQELITHNQTVYQLSQVPLDMTLGKILLIQDVTSARQLQDHINRHQRLRSMGEMAASLAHQIRTPLAAALLYVSQLANNGLQEDKRQKFVNKTLLSLKHLDGLVKDMLQYAKGGSVGEALIEVDELLQSIVPAVEQHIHNSESELMLHPVAPGLVIKGDRDSLMTAMQNLVVNAVDVVRYKARVEIKVNAVYDNWVDLVVSDQGPGIEPAIQEKIFEPFYTSRAKGTGLGLAVVRTVAEAHGGEVWVRSVLGRGAQFGIRLPLCKQGVVSK